MELNLEIDLMSEGAHSRAHITWMRNVKNQFDRNCNFAQWKIDQFQSRRCSIGGNKRKKSIKQNVMKSKSIWKWEIFGFGNSEENENANKWTNWM